MLDLLARFRMLGLRVREMRQLRPSLLQWDAIGSPAVVLNPRRAAFALG